MSVCVCVSAGRCCCLFDAWLGCCDFVSGAVDTTGFLVITKSAFEADFIALISLYVRPV